MSNISKIEKRIWISLVTQKQLNFQNQNIGFLKEKCHIFDVLLPLPTIPNELHAHLTAVYHQLIHGRSSIPKENDMTYIKKITSTIALYVSEHNNYI